MLKIERLGVEFIRVGFILLFGVKALGKVVELIRPGELDKVPRGKWAAVRDGVVVAWADTLEKLRKVMKEKGFRRDEYYVIKVPRHDLMIV
ncbi:MAG: DUF5678 domain-containing protein [archaeon GB-1867-035]|nr:DUF5678 domain-containing protein [Candidatus Culexmicrobium profundum]